MNREVARGAVQLRQCLSKLGLALPGFVGGELIPDALPVMAFAGRVQSSGMVGAGGAVNARLTAVTAAVIGLFMAVSLLFGGELVLSVGGFKEGRLDVSQQPFDLGWAQVGILAAEIATGLRDCIQSRGAGLIGAIEQAAIFR